MRDERPRVIGLVRVSTKGQADDDRAGVPRQREVIRQIVACEKLDCIKTIEVNDVSGTEVRNCPEIVAILDDLRSHSIHGIVVADFDRFMRPDSLTKFGLLDIFEETRTVLYFQGSRIDFSTDSGFLTAGFNALIAGNEIRTFKRRVQGAKEELRKQGKCPNAAITLPTGVAYDRKNEAWGYTPEVVQVKEAFRLVDEEHVTNYRELERRTGIHHRTLHNILRNPIYVGVRLIDKKRGAEKYASEDGRQSDRRKVKRLPHEVIRIPVIEEPAVDLARFKRVQIDLGGKKTAWSSARSTPSPRLLTGVGCCGECGEVLYCSSNGGKIRRKPGYYICRRNYYLYRSQTGGCHMRNLRQDTTDEIVISWIADRLTDRQVLKGILANYLGTQKSSVAESGRGVADVQKALDAIEQKRNRLHRGWIDGRFTDQEHDSMRQELDTAEQRLAALAARLPNSPARTDIEKRLALLLKGALAFARIQDRLKQKVVIQQLFAEIHVGNDGIKGFKIRPQFDADVCEDGSHTRRDSWRPRA